MLYQKICYPFFDTKNYSNYRYDHALVALKLLNKLKMGLGFWKINNSLLHNTVFVIRINDEIILNIQTYACSPYGSDLLYHINNLDFMIDIDVFFDVLSAQQRGFKKIIKQIIKHP